MPLSPALGNLEAAIMDACATQAEWPARVAAGVCAGIDYAIEHPEVIETLACDASPGAATVTRYASAIGHLTGLLRECTPAGKRPPSSDEALVTGMVGLVGDHLRLGRLERLRSLRPELVLVTLLPYLGFAEAQRWADWSAR